MRTRGLVQIAREAAVAAGNAGRERGPSQTPPAFAVGIDDEKAHTVLRTARGWLDGMRVCRLVGQDSRASGVRMIVRRLPTGGPWFDSQELERRFRPAKTGRKDGTTASQRPRIMALADAAKRLGPLICNQAIAMTLDNFPTPCGCIKHSHAPDLPDGGTTHNPGEPCPFEMDNFPKGKLGTCCSLRGKVAACELDALGETYLSNRMFDDMTAEEAETFSEELRATANRLECFYAGVASKPTGSGRNATWNAKTKELVYRDCSTFEEALSAIREAARWYEKVARLGYGVHTEH